MKRLAVVALLMLASVSCGEARYTTPFGSPTENPGDGDPEKTVYEATGTVLQEDGSEPELCLGVLLDSLPPQCGGPRIAGWDWEDVEGEQAASGTTWGDFHVSGTFDGKVFTVLETGPPQPSGAADHPIGSGCPEPAGGWEIPDPSKASDRDRIEVMRAARRSPDFSGLWIDYIGTPSESSDSDNDYVLNVAFTGDLQRHEADIREIWGGALCVVGSERTLDELRLIQEELTGRVGQEMGLEVLYASSSENRNVVEIGVTVATEEALRAIEERYGEGVVEVDARLRPIP